MHLGGDPIPRSRRSDPLWDPTFTVWQGPRRQLLKHTEGVRRAREETRLAELAAKEAARKAKAAAIIEALARGTAQRKLYREELRREAEARRAELESEMASRMQGLARGAMGRKVFAKLKAAELAKRQAALEAASATRLAASARGAAGRRVYREMVAVAAAERRRIELEVKTPSALVLQARR